MATASNQDQLNTVVNELILRVNDALKAALATIDVGDAQALGMLSLYDDLASAPPGDLASLRDALDLGSAAALDAQSNTSDTTVDRLMRTGAQGWAGTAVSVPGSNANNMTATGIHFPNYAANAFPGANIASVLMHIQGYNSLYALQMGYRCASTDEPVWVRGRKGSTGYHDWKYFIDSQNLADQFPQQLSKNGWKKLPGGYIEQWGSIEFSGGGVQFNWPIAFPNEILNVNVSTESNVFNAPTFQNPTLTTVYLQSWDQNGNAQSAPFTIHVKAIGR